MPKLAMAAEMSWRSPIIASITSTEPETPTTIAPNRRRVTAPFLTGARLVESCAIRSSVRIVAPPIFGQVFAQRFDGAMDGHFHRRFRQAGARRGVRHADPVQL